MLYRRLVAQAAAAGDGDGDPGASRAAAPPISHVHARALSVLLSVLLSRAGAATGVYDLVPGVPQLLAQGGGGGSELARALSLDARNAEVAAVRGAAAAGAMATAPPLKASDAEDAVAGGAVAASAAVRAIMRAGADGFS